MRLKSLFFPIVMVISLTLIIFVIRPQISEIRSINKEKVAKINKLQKIASVQVAIDSAGNKLKNNSAGEQSAKNYLPEKKVEERIIGGVNYLAGDSSVSLVDISIVGVNNSASAIAPASTTPAIDPLTNLPVSSPIVMQTVSAKISISGEYEKIRIFLDGLTRMPVFNNIKSLSIKKQVVEKTEASGEVPATPAGNSNILLADITVDFGYMGVSKVNVANIENFKQEFDAETISALNSYVSQKTQFNGGDAVVGRVNPFVAN